MSTDLNDLADPEPLVRELELEGPEQPLVSACPVLLIGLGGTGAAVLRRVKQRILWIGMNNYCRFLVLDTDDNVQGSREGLPGFENNEFCHLNVQQLLNPLRSPKAHPFLCERLELDDPQN